MTEGLHRLLFRDQLDDLLRLHEFLPRLADADVDHDLLDPDVAHARHGPPYSADTSGVLIDGASLPTTNTLPASVEKPSVNVTMFARGFRVRWTSDRKSTRLNSSHLVISYAVFCLKKKKNTSNRRVNQITIHRCRKSEITTTLKH